MINVYGSNDDLIEIDGDICEEFGLELSEADNGVVIGFSCGTLVHCRYDKTNLWRLTVLVQGRAKISISPATDVDTDYSDTVTIDPEEPVVWITKGQSYIHNNRLIELS